MQICFGLLALIGLIYFLFAKRQFDFFSLAFLSSCIYFSPGFMGYALYPAKPVRVPVPLVDEAYWILTVVLFSIVLSAIVFDRCRVIGQKQPKIFLKGTQLAHACATVLALAGLAITIFTTGNALLYLEKSRMMMELNRWHILCTMSASLGVVWAVIKRDFVLGTVCLIILLFDVYIGFRSSFAITIITIFVLFLSAKGRQRLGINSWRVGILGTIVASSLFIYKFLVIAVKGGFWGIVIDRLGDPNFYAYVFIHSEPFTIQAILNEVLQQDFHVGMDHFVSVVYNFMLFAPDLGAESVSFNSLFQTALFSWQEAGMANNIWAEMWSSGGWVLLLIFIVVFNCILAFGSYFLRMRDPVLRSWIALLGSYWAFYIHRNDIAYQFTLEKRIFLVGFFCIIVSVFLSSFGSYRVRKASEL